MVVFIGFPSRAVVVSMNHVYRVPTSIALSVVVSICVRCGVRFISASTFIPMVVCIGFPFRAVAVCYGVAVCDVTSCTYCLFGASCSTATMSRFVELFFASRTFMPMVICVGRPNVFRIVSKRFTVSGVTYRANRLFRASCRTAGASNCFFMICVNATHSRMRSIVVGSPSSEFVRRTVNGNR